LADLAEVELDTVERSARRRLAPLVAAGVAVVLIVLFVVLAAADGDRAESADSPLIGNVAPDAHGALADGAPFELARRRGSWVVLNFFTHNCVPCIQEHPELIEFSQQQAALGSDGAELYTIVRDSNHDEVEQFFSERGGDWPIVYDPNFEFSNGFGVALVPETWIIDDAGYVRARIIQPVTAEGLGSLIQQMRAVA
jgi:cytochrome c biogenesis protein CcmG/thiol:disulfide interchange protein DsbE